MVLGVVLVAPSANAEPVAGGVLAGGTISTVAGSTQGFSGDAAMANMAMVQAPQQVALLPGGGYLIVESVGRVRRVSPTGTISTVAGTGSPGFSGDNGPATSAQLSFPRGVTALPDGGFLIADTDNHRIRRVSPDGTISTVVGTGVRGFAGNGGPAINAQLSSPWSVAMTADGGFLIADSGNHRIRQVSAAGVITAVAGNGSAGFSGDGGSSTNAKLHAPRGVAVLPDGGYLVSDSGNQRIRRVSASSMISTMAGGGTVVDTDEQPQPAMSVKLAQQGGLALLPDGGFLIADTGHHRIRRVFPNGFVTTVAGRATPGSDGDGAMAKGAGLNLPMGVTALPGGGFLIADNANNRVRRAGVSISTDAGRGATLGDGGEGSIATEAQLDTPSGLLALSADEYLIADTNNHRLRQVSANGNRITTVAGGGPPGVGPGDGKFSFNVELGTPHGLGRRFGGSPLIADVAHDTVRSIFGLSITSNSFHNTISTVAGPAAVDSPRGVAGMPDASILIADTNNHRVLRVSPDGSTITTVAGTGFVGSGGDGGFATGAQLFFPSALAALPDGGFLIADAGNGRIRRVSADGRITRVAGSTPGYSGDGGPATDAQLNNPRGVTALPDGGFLIADTNNHRVRHVAPDGTITTIAGTTSAGLSGDGGPATNAQLNHPTAVALIPFSGGDILVADTNNHRIRKVTALNS